MLLYIHRNNSFIFCKITLTAQSSIFIEIEDDGEKLNFTENEDFLPNSTSISFDTMHYTIGNIWLQNIQYLQTILSIHVELDSSEEKTVLKLEIPTSI